MRDRTAVVDIRGQAIDEARLDEAFRPERYVTRLGPVFDRLERLA